MPGGHRLDPALQAAWATSKNRANVHLSTERYRQLMLKAATARSSGEGTVVSTPLPSKGRLIAE